MDHRGLEPKLERFDIFGGDVAEVGDGYWVRYDDHAAAIEALEAEVARLRDGLDWVEEHASFADRDTITSTVLAILAEGGATNV